MTTQTIDRTRTAATGPRSVSFLRLTLLHAKYNILESIRIPIAVIGNLMFPTLAMFFFVVPQSSVTSDPVWSMISVGGLAMFSVMSTFLFTFGVGVAEDRALPFDPYLRTMPAGAAPRMVGRIVSACAFALVALVPLGLVAGIFTAAAPTPGQLLLGVVTLLAAGIPFLMLGLFIGYSLSSKAAIAVVQVVLFPLAFAGGLFMPAEMFPSWLERLSTFLPSRAGRDLVIGAFTGTDVYAHALPVLLAWGVTFTALAVWAYRRDEGRRFR
ncbi:ABC transporter permease [Pseudactinotalea suaedae]|uniref:ABC transporter permease n=1 Tax=Pseudactinotalea suaedae TaxID=1524924 RepID=UPI0012E1D8FC|nr:ABC transporter permease [Pseudactinotalea suaedae]